MSMFSSLLAENGNRRIQADNSPNPRNFEVLSYLNGKDYHIVVAKYPDATNYEGKKIMVYRGSYSPDIKVRDPHFADDDTAPVARFKPTEEGMKLALSIVAPGLMSSL